MGPHPRTRGRELWCVLPIGKFGPDILVFVVAVYSLQDKEAILYIVGFTAIWITDNASCWLPVAPSIYESLVPATSCKVWIDETDA